MNSIADHFGKKKNKIPLPEVAHIPLVLPRSTELHPAAQQAAVVYSEALMELDRLKQINERLTNDLEVERRSNALLQQHLAEERTMKESYQRYAIQIKTDLSHIVDIAMKANSRAKEQAESPREQSMTRVEEAMRDAVMQENSNG